MTLSEGFALAIKGHSFDPTREMFYKSIFMAGAQAALNELLRGPDSTSDIASKMVNMLAECADVGEKAHAMLMVIERDAAEQNEKK